MAYQLQFNLQQKATLNRAISIWNHQEVKDKITKWFVNLRKGEYGLNIGDWEQLTSTELKKINKDKLPSQLRSELIYIVKVLGEKIMKWYLYIRNEHRTTYGERGDIINYIGEIYWTSIGTIDEVKTLQSLWLKNPNLNNAVVFKIACKIALEEDIYYLWQKMSREIKDCYYTSNPLAIYGSKYGGPYYDHLILAYWKYFRYDQIDYFAINVAPNLSRDENGRVVYKETYSLNHNMFLLSVYKGYSTAAKYFWEKLTQEEKDSSLVYSAHLAVDRNSHKFQLTNYEREKYVEILIFIINQMTLNQKKSFLKGESVPDEVNNFHIEIKNVMKEIFSMLLFFWPWQELLIPLFNDMLPYLEDNKQLVLDILFEVSDRNVQLNYFAEYRKRRSILHEAWLIIPGSIKRTMIQNVPDSHLSDNFIINLLELEDMNSIEMIFNDPEIADVRMQYIEFGRKGYKTSINLKRYKFLNQFMKKILRSEEEKIYFKSVINHIDVCLSFIKCEKYGSVDKFLNWQFETVEEIKKCKDHLKSYQFFLNWVFETLKSNLGMVEMTKEETSRFLKWMFKSEDEIVKFKKEFIENSEPLIKKKVFYESALHELTEQEVQEIKQILE